MSNRNTLNRKPLHRRALPVVGLCLLMGISMGCDELGIATVAGVPVAGGPQTILGEGFFFSGDPNFPSTVTGAGTFRALDGSPINVGLTLTAVSGFDFEGSVSISGFGLDCIDPNFRAGVIKNFGTEELQYVISAFPSSPCEFTLVIRDDPNHG